MADDHFEFNKGLGSRIVMQAKLDGISPGDLIEKAIEQYIWNQNGGKIVPFPQKPEPQSEINRRMQESIVQLSGIFERLAKVMGDLNARLAAVEKTIFKQ